MRRGAAIVALVVAKALLAAACGPATAAVATVGAEVPLARG